MSVCVCVCVCVCVRACVRACVCIAEPSTHSRARKNLAPMAERPERFQNYLILLVHPLRCQSAERQTNGAALSAWRRGRRPVGRLENETRHPLLPRPRAPVSETARVSSASVPPFAAATRACEDLPAPFLTYMSRQREIIMWYRRPASWRDAFLGEIKKKAEGRRERKKKKEEGGKNERKKKKKKKERKKEKTHGGMTNALGNRPERM